MFVSILCRSCFVSSLYTYSWIIGRTSGEKQHNICVLGFQCEISFICVYEKKLVCSVILKLLCYITFTSSSYLQPPKLITQPGVQYFLRASTSHFHTMARNGEESTHPPTCLDIDIYFIYDLGCFHIRWK